MKNISFILLATTILFFGSCEDKMVKLYPTMDGKKEFVISNVGSFSNEVIISRADIEASLKDLDIPAEGEVLSVSVETVQLKVAPKADNACTAVMVSGTIQEIGVATKKEFVKNFQLPVPTEPMTIKLGGLVEAGVAEFTSQLDRIIRTKTLPADFTGLKCVVSGTSFPVDKKLSFDMELIVKITIEYQQKVKI
ncbi:MAG: hypothetical protein RIS47_1477 [Bacteroidota bacterium]|jgi:hypothetical protein